MNIIKLFSVMTLTVVSLSLGACNFGLINSNPKDIIYNARKNIRIQKPVYLSINNGGWGEFGNAYAGIRSTVRTGDQFKIAFSATEDLLKPTYFMFEPGIVAKGRRTAILKCFIRVSTGPDNSIIINPQIRSDLPPGPSIGGRRPPINTSPISGNITQTEIDYFITKALSLVMPAKLPAVIPTQHRIPRVIKEKEKTDDPELAIAFSIPETRTHELKDKAPSAPSAIMPVKSPVMHAPVTAEPEAAPSQSKAAAQLESTTNPETTLKIEDLQKSLTPADKKAVPDGQPADVLAQAQPAALVVQVPAFLQSPALLPCDEKIKDNKDEFLKYCDSIPLEDLSAYLLAYADNQYEHAVLATIIEKKKEAFLATLETITEKDLQILLDNLTASLTHAPAQFSKEQLEVRTVTIESMKLFAPAVQQTEPHKQQAIQTFRDSLSQKEIQCQTFDQKIKFVFALLSMRDQIAQIATPKEFIGICSSTMHAKTSYIREKLTSAAHKRPSWLYDDYWSRVFHNTPIEHAWKNFQDAHGKIDRLTEKLEEKYTRTYHASLADLIRLYHVRVAFLELNSRTQKLGNLGFDHISRQDKNITRKEYTTLLDTSSNLTTLANTFINYIQTSPAACPPVELIRTYCIPRYIYSNKWKKYFTDYHRVFVTNEECWQTYVNDVRAFVIRHYKTNMTFDEIKRICPTNAHLSCHNYLARKLVLLERLKDLVTGDCDVDYGDEYDAVHKELDSFEACLVDMITIIRKHEGYVSDSISAKDLNDVAQRMDTEAEKEQSEYIKKLGWLDYARRFGSDAVRAAGCAAVNALKNTKVGVSTDFTGRFDGHVGPISFTLYKPETDHSQTIASLRKIPRPAISQDPATNPNTKNPKDPSTDKDKHNKTATPLRVFYGIYSFEPISQSSSAPQQPDAASNIVYYSPSVMFDFKPTKQEDLSLTNDASAHDLRECLENVEEFLREKAHEQEAKGNDSFAQELLADAHYVGDCIKAFGKCAGAKFDETTAKLINNLSFIKNMRLMRNIYSFPKTELIHPAISEQKYNGIIEEWCARAGCFVGEHGLDILLLALSVAGSGGTASPIISFVPLVTVDGAVALVPVEAAGVAEIIKIVTAGALMAAGPQYTDKGGADNTVPPQPPVNDKINPQTEALKIKAQKNLTDDVVKEIRGEGSDLEKTLNQAEVNAQIDEMFQGKKDLTHLKREFKEKELNIQMLTGHSYYRQHSKGGDARKICDLNKIEKAVMEQALTKENLNIIRSNGRIQKTFEFMGHTIEYEAKNVPDKGFISIDYYPKH